MIISKSKKRKNVSHKLKAFKGRKTIYLYHQLTEVLKCLKYNKSHSSTKYEMYTAIECILRPNVQH